MTVSRFPSSSVAPSGNSGFRGLGLSKSGQRGSISVSQSSMLKGSVLPSTLPSWRDVVVGKLGVRLPSSA